MTNDNQQMTNDKQPLRSLEEALDRCRKLGMRVSYQRQLILKLLWRSREHLSVREIYHRLTKQGENVALTSIYQNLAALSKQGIVECLERSNGNLYGSFNDSHSHVNCLESDRIINIWIELPASLIEEVERQTNVKVIDYRIEFYARC